MLLWYVQILYVSVHYKTKMQADIWTIDANVLLKLLNLPCFPDLLSVV